MRIVLVPGRIAPWNGQMTMIDAARLMVANGERNTVFVFAGDDRFDPRYTRALRRRARMHGIDTLCRLVGHCPDMPLALAAADVVVVPALEPPLSGRAAAEAQAMGRPVIVTTVGVLPENMLGPPRMPEELRTGWLVRPGNIADLARACVPGAQAQYHRLRGARRPRPAIRRVHVLAAERCPSHPRGLYVASRTRRMSLWGLPRSCRVPHPDFRPAGRAIFRHRAATPPTLANSAIRSTP